MSDWSCSSPGFIPPVKPRVKGFAVQQIISRDKIICRPTQSLAVVPHPASGEKEAVLPSPDLLSFFFFLLESNSLELLLYLDATVTVYTPFSIMAFAPSA